MSERTYTTAEAAAILGIRGDSLTWAVGQGLITPLPKTGIRKPNIFTETELRQYDLHRKNANLIRGQKLAEARGCAGRAIRPEGARADVLPERLPVVGSGARVAPQWQRDAMDLEREMRRMMRGMR